MFAACVQAMYRATRQNPYKTATVLRRSLYRELAEVFQELLMNLSAG